MRLQLETQILQIVDGPGKFELSISLFDGESGGWPDDQDRRSVSFKLTEKHKKAQRIRGYIESASREGAESDEFALQIKLSKRCREVGLEDCYNRFAHLQYNTRTRKGSIVLGLRMPVATGQLHT